VEFLLHMILLLRMGGVGKAGKDRASIRTRRRQRFTAEWELETNFKRSTRTELARVFDLEG
jgi:hypothetical protein